MFGSLFASLVGALFIAALPSSTHYQLKDYGVNSGSTNSSSGSTYRLQGATGELGGGSTGSQYVSKSSSIEAQQASVPPAPTVSNGSGAYYNKLQVTIINTANPSDATFAIQESTQSNFSSVSYVQADGTLGSSIVWQNYSSWGGISGITVTGLSASTTYYFRVSAQEGKFTASAFGPSANSTTASNSPSITFSVSPNSIGLGNLTPGSIITGSTINFTFTTNATNGGAIYISGDSTGLLSPSNSNYTIAVSAPSGNLDSLNEGYGLQSTGASSLTAQSDYTNGGNIVGAITTSFKQLYTASSPVASGSATAVVKVKSQLTDPPGSDYANTLTFVAAASY